jgi:hypothetical protein
MMFPMLKLDCCIQEEEDAGSEVFAAMKLEKEGALKVAESAFLYERLDHGFRSHSAFILGSCYGC